MHSHRSCSRSCLSIFILFFSLFSMTRIFLLAPFFFLRISSLLLFSLCYLRLTWYHIDTVAIVLLFACGMNGSWYGRIFSMFVIWFGLFSWNFSCFKNVLDNRVWQKNINVHTHILYLHNHWSCIQIPKAFKIFFLSLRRFFVWFCFLPICNFYFFFSPSFALLDSC